MIKVDILILNPFQENTYILSDETKECIIIDAGCYTPDEKETLKNHIEKNGYKPVGLYNTHCHIDHIVGNLFICEQYNLELRAHKNEEPVLQRAQEFGRIFEIELDKVPKIRKYITENEIIKLGNSELKALFVPGHSPGSIAFYCEKDNFVVVGDVLFKGSIGRTDLPGGNYDVLMESIKTKLLTLPDETNVFPGHGDVTTIGYEKKSNPFLE